MSQNRYAYVHNNPINYKDPSGHYVAFENPDDDAVSRVVNAKQKASPDKIVKWDEGVNSHFEGKPAKKAAYQQKAQESAKRTQDYNIAREKEMQEKREEQKRKEDDLKRQIAEKTGDLGYIAQKSFEGYLAKGHNVEEAFQMAIGIEKIYSELRNEHIGDIKTKLENMKLSGAALGDLFKWRSEYIPGDYRNATQGHDFEYTYFDTIINETRNGVKDFASWADKNLNNIASGLAVASMVAITGGLHLEHCYLEQ